MIFHIPHATRKIPAEVRNQVLLTDAELKRELLAMTDAYTDELFSADLAPGDTTVIFPVSRLVVDPERFADDDAEPLAKRGMGRGLCENPRWPAAAPGACAGRKTGVAGHVLHATSPEPLGRG